VWVTSYSVGGAIGPLLGGVLLQYFWWGSVFLIGVPVMLLLLVLGPVLLPEFRDPEAGQLDLFSAALSLAAVLLVIYGLKRIAEHGLALLIGAGLVAAAVGFGVLTQVDGAAGLGAIVLGSVIYGRCGRGPAATTKQPLKHRADALARIRTGMPCGAAPSRQCVYQFHHQGG